MTASPVAPPPEEPLRFGVVDLETTGLRVDRHRIIQLGLVVVDGGQVVDRWSTFARLRRPWHRVGARHVHGIRRRDLRGAPALRTVLDELATRLDGCIFTAHNAAFDGAFLERAAVAEGSPLQLGDRLCTLRMSRQLDPERRFSHRLTDLCARYDVHLDRPHDALADALATARVLAHLLAAHQVTSTGQLVPFYASLDGAPADVLVDGDDDGDDARADDGGDSRSGPSGPGSP